MRCYLVVMHYTVAMQLYKNKLIHGRQFSFYNMLQLRDKLSNEGYW